ncbi:phosphatidylinositol glycan, class W [Blastocystis sp. ATCC 50177/Nand II]|uniref:Phosphatidylinositol glycan, class W n=1 Tax=Blastocystis sp. subtype 1 (strain ATCC 50177 / NandII) TaxID=478820 RepID=A0A196SR26_BLAHN|nr:phosphatidylinositol glycan, class W [Blastocystis sp. ATCC 50177/Nand II]
MTEGEADILSLAHSNYDQAKELFAINVHGCSLMDILSTILISPLLCTIYQGLCDLLFKSHWYNRCPKSLLYVLHVILEVILFPIPVLLVCTVYSKRLYLYMGLCLLSALLYYVNTKVQYDDETKKNSALILSVGTVDSDVKGYITAFRGIVVLYTCIVILAVDFPVFPRKFAKTYLNGYSLMDIGVGLYIVTSGIVAPMKRLDIMAFFKRQFLLLILGLSRLLFVRYSGYVVNVVEYGRDWNFFFTLFFVLFAGFVLVNFVRSWTGQALVGAGVLAYYQFLLWFGLAEFLHDNKGKSLVDLNAPGLFSCFGFLALYLFAAAIGSRLRQKGSQLRFLVASAACAAGAYACLARFVQPASRRMCNASFVLLVLLIALVILTVAYAINAFVGSFHVPILLDAFNRNQLTVFIVANALTGVVNMTVKTLLMSNQTAMAILVIYTLVVCLSAVLLPKIRL